MFRVSTIKRLAGIGTGVSDFAVENLCHQLLQRCSVSGTAKGKGKIKGVQPLKRSKITMKKGAAGSGGGGDRRTGLTVELEEMAKKCLDAPSPIRFLKPKEREREAQREKLGLISKDRQREIETLKQLAKQGTGLEKRVVMGPPGMDFISLGLVDADANRFMATLTPPIEGYIDKVREAAEKMSGKEKLR